MKKNLFYSVLLAGFAAILSACTKDDTEAPPPPPDLSVPIPLIIKDTTAEVFISAKDPGSFTGKFIVDLYSRTGITPQKMDVVVMKNNDRVTIKTIQEDITTFPASIQVTGTQLTTLFDSTIQLGDKFELGANVTTKNGKKFEAFPYSGNPYNLDSTNLPGSSLSVVYVADCKFDFSYFNGYYIVQHPTWDLKVGEPVFVSPGGGNTLKILAWPHHDLGLSVRVPMIVNVDPATSTITSIPWQVTGEYAGGPALIIEEGKGTLSPCGDWIRLTALMWVDPVVYGPQILNLKR